MDDDNKRPNGQPNPKKKHQAARGHRRYRQASAVKTAQKTPRKRPAARKAAGVRSAKPDDSKAPPSSSKTRRRSGRYKVRKVWWAAPVALAMSVVLVLLCSFMVVEIKGYAGFLQKKNTVSRQTFYPGVSMEGVDLSGMTLEQAMQIWNERDQKERDSYSLSLKLDDQAWRVDAESLGYQTDYDQVLESAWSVGRYGTLDERYQVVGQLTEQNWQREFMPTRGLDEGAALEKLGAFADSLGEPVVNAQVLSFNEREKSFEFSDSKQGARVDPQELLQAIRRAAKNGEDSVTVVRHVVEPTDTKQTLSESYGLISSASTNASSSVSNRLTNLNVACKTLNGTRVEPGETFSFNQTLGQRTTKKGYRPAGAYENGITTNQIGGGICQVSTTLFNAVAKADMKIVERSPHSRPSSYIGIGKDAAVNWPNQDFKFTNTSDYPIYITAQLTKKRNVAISVYGKKLAGGIRIEISSEKTKTVPAGPDQITLDSNLLPGERVVVEKARDGYSAVAYRHYFDANGNEIKKVLLCRSSYASAGAIIRVGG